MFDNQIMVLFNVFNLVLFGWIKLDLIRIEKKVDDDFRRRS